MDSNNSNIPFRQAIEFVNFTDRHIFLTGKAGSGKTTFLKTISDSTSKNLVILAPTGVAAVNAGGTTIHSFFQLPFGLFLPVALKTYVPVVYIDKDGLVKNSNFNTAKKDLLRQIDVIVIDEVSMVRADILDAIDTLLRFTRNQPSIAFGGVQMIFVGDLFQLSPVIKPEEWDCLKEHYSTPFFFSAHALQQAPPLQIELKKIYRQKDTSFIQLLNNIRENHCSEADFSMLNSKYSPSVNGASNNHIILTTHNAKVEKINDQKLASLPGDELVFEAIITGEFPENNYPAEKALRLKAGAQIMLTKNDNGDSRKYYNGKIGMIEKMEERSLHIRFPEGQLLILERETWTNIKYRLGPAGGKVGQEELGTFRQFPVRLAWAITIHKSQGLTFENAIIDAKESFSPGQVYVALSRLTSLNGLVLSSPIFPGAVRADQRILEYSRLYPTEDTLQQTLQNDQRSFLFKKILKYFDFTNDTDSMQLFINKYTEDKHLPEVFQKIAQHQQVAGKFVEQLSSIYFGNNPPDLDKVAERTHSATRFFTGEYDQIRDKLTGQLSSIKSQKGTKDYTADLNHLLSFFQTKSMEMARAAIISNGLAKNELPADINVKLDAIQQPKQEIQEDNSPKRPDTQPSSTEGITLQLYHAGYTMDKIAKKRKMALATVEMHLIKAIQAGQLSVFELIEPVKLEKVASILTKENCEFPAVIRQQLGPSFSYTEIRAAIAHCKSMNTTG